MKKQVALHLLVLGCLILLIVSISSSQQAIPTASITDTKDPLPSWNEGQNKQAILDFVRQSADEATQAFIPENERIAVFDNDGTLWSEQPMYFQFLFTLDRIGQLAQDHPEWREQQPFRAVLENDMETLMKSGPEGMGTLTMATHTGLSTAEFEQVVKEWIQTARHPQTGMLYKEMVFQPMLEVLDFFRAHGFKTYIVSGGGMEFIRPWTEEVYGIPPGQVIGSSIKMKFEYVDGKPVIMRLPELDFINDQEGKPVGIEKFIGRRPVAAFGNSDGDLQMLQWTEAGGHGRLMVYIHHTDAEREWAYDRESPVGKLDKGLDEATAKGWLIVNMKEDWKVIYPAGKE